MHEKNWSVSLKMDTGTIAIVLSFTDFLLKKLQKNYLKFKQ